MLKWRSEYDKLAMYNAEVSRGIVHTPEWIAKMSKLQKEYNRDFFIEEEISE